MCNIRFKIPVTVEQTYQEDGICGEKNSCLALIYLPLENQSEN